jgi:RNA polymerase sigma factor (sigma-70 family)
VNGTRPPQRLAPPPPRAAGRDPSFEAFYERERDRVFGALCLVTGSRHDAEELTQDAFLALWERWQRVRALDDPTGYLYRTAMNGFRKRLRRAALARRLAPRLWRAREGGDELRSEVMDALGALPPRQRAAVVLTELLGYGSEEAGRLLGVKAVTVRVLASQGRAVLRRELGAEAPGGSEVEDA